MCISSNCALQRSVVARPGPKKLSRTFADLI